VVYRYGKPKQFPASLLEALICSPEREQYNDLSLIQAIIFIKNVLQYYAPLLSCLAGEHNAPTNSSDISF
jgi:hypothetical protein